MKGDIFEFHFFPPSLPRSLDLGEIVRGINFWPPPAIFRNSRGKN